ncbi:hypothetical protein [Aliikangiella sp. IMCC44632]
MLNTQLKLACIAMSGILLGCTSLPKAQVEQRIQAWKSQNLTEIVKYWGLPSKQYQLNDLEYAEWKNQLSEEGNSAISIGSGRSSRSTSIGLGFTLFNLGGGEKHCLRQISADANGKVLEIIWRGDHAFCHKLTPELATIKNNAND